MCNKYLYMINGKHDKIEKFVNPFLVKPLQGRSRVAPLARGKKEIQDAIDLMNQGILEMKIAVCEKFSELKRLSSASSKLLKHQEKHARLERARFKLQCTLQDLHTNRGGRAREGGGNSWEEMQTFTAQHNQGLRSHAKIDGFCSRGHSETDASAAKGLVATMRACHKRDKQGHWRTEYLDGGQLQLLQSSSSALV